MYREFLRKFSNKNTGCPRENIAKGIQDVIEKTEKTELLEYVQGVLEKIQR